ncbi:CHAP domain-containing protein [Enterococcus faecalis]
MGGIFRIFPFDMEHTITRQIFCPWLFAFSMTRKQFQGRKPYNYLASFLLFQCRLKESFHGQLVKPIVPGIYGHTGIITDVSDSENYFSTVEQNAKQGES